MNLSWKNISFFYSWDKVPDEMLANIMAEFSWQGVEQLVCVSGWLKRLLDDPDFFNVLQRNLRKNHLKLGDAHGLCGHQFDLCCTDCDRRAGLVSDHKTAMNYCAELGCRTYVMHIGAFESVRFGTPNERLRPLSLETLEQLLPTAEKLGLIIAVENSYERSNTPDEVLYCINYFDSKYIRCCYDTGHAHIMEPEHGKIRNEELQRAWRGNGVDYPDAVGRLAPYIVTCHMHDNDGRGDAHGLPGTGTVDWKELMPKLKRCPGLLSMQTEVHTDCGLSVGQLVAVFKDIMNFA